MKRVVLLLVAWLLGCAAPAFADPAGAVSPGTPGTQSWLGGCRYVAAGVTLQDGQQVAIQCDASGNVKTTGGGGGGGGAVSPAAVTTTQAAGAVTTHLVFQSALAANASRKFCTIMNTSTDTEYVFWGANASATTTNAYPLAAGQPVNCPPGDVTNVAITSLVTNGAAYVVSSSQ